MNLYKMLLQIVFIHFYQVSSANTECIGIDDLNKRLIDIGKVCESYSIVNYYDDVDSLIVAPGKKEVKILFVGGFEGDVESANVILKIAKYYCEGINKSSDKTNDFFDNLKIFSQDHQVEFIPTGNPYFYNLAVSNDYCSSGKTKAINKTVSCEATEIDYINPDLNFDINFKDVCKDKNGSVDINKYTGSIAFESNVAKRFRDRVNSNKYSFIGNIQGDDMSIYIPYDFGKPELTDAQQYFYDTLFGEQDSTRSVNTRRRGTMMDYFMNTSGIYSAVYSYNHGYFSNIQRFYESIFSVYFRPNFKVIEAEEDAKPSNSNPSTITFEYRITNTYQQELNIDCEITIVPKNQDMKLYKTNDDLLVKYATLGSNINKKTLSNSKFNSDIRINRGKYTVQLNLTIPESTIIYILPKFNRKDEGSFDYDVVVSLSSTDDKFNDYIKKIKDQSVKTSSKSSNKNKFGIILLMFLIFILVIATILCTILIKDKKYRILA